MKIQATLKDLRENPSLVCARAFIRRVAELDLAMQAARDAAIRDTADMDADKVAAREGIMNVAESMIAVSYVRELNYALDHLESVAVHE